MKVKTAELTGAALDWAVAKCEGLEVNSQGRAWVPDPDMLHFNKQFKPSTDWAQAGPIIERERISVISDYHEVKEGWLAEGYENGVQVFGPAPLIAAMRCYVASKLGDEIDLPEELT